MERCRKIGRTSGIKAAVEAYQESFTYIDQQFPKKSASKQPLRSSFVKALSHKENCAYDEAIQAAYKVLFEQVDGDVHSLAMLCNDHAAFQVSRSDIDGSDSVSRSREMYSSAVKLIQKNLRRWCLPPNTAIFASKCNQLFHSWQEFEADHSVVNGSSLWAPHVYSAAETVGRAKRALTSYIDSLEETESKDMPSGVKPVNKKVKERSMAAVGATVDNSAAKKRKIDQVEDTKHEESSGAVVKDESSKKSRTGAVYEDYHVLYSPQAGNMVRVTQFDRTSDSSLVEYFEQIFAQVSLHCLCSTLLQCGKIVEVLVNESDVIVEFLNAVFYSLFDFLVEWREKSGRTG